MAGEIADIMIKALKGKTLEEFDQIDDELEAIYTIEIGSVKIIEKSSTSYISMYEMNEEGDFVIFSKQWEAMKKAQTKARMSFLRRLPEFYGLNDQLDDCDFENMSKYSAYLKE